MPRSAPRARARRRPPPHTPEAALQHLPPPTAARRTARGRAVALASLALASLALLTLAACGGDDADPATAADGTAATDATDAATAAHPALTTPLDAVGPHPVGYRVVEVSYDGPAGLGKRVIPLHLFYPADLSGAAADAYPHPAPHGGIIADATSRQGAPAAAPPPGSRWPLMVYSHGHQGFAGSSAFVAWRFASQGWVVAAPDHVGNLLSDAILPRPTWMYFARPLDVSRAIDRVAALGATEGFAADAVATDKVLLVGHSFGAHNCWAAAGAAFDIATIQADCQAEGGTVIKGDCSAEALAVFAAGLREPRVVATVPMAGTVHRNLMGAKGHESAAIPVLTLSGTKDPIGADQEFAAIHGVDHTWVELLGATHQSFAVTCSAPAPKDTTCATILRWSLAFGRFHVLGDTSVQALLDGDHGGDPVVSSYQRRTKK